MITSEPSNKVAGPLLMNRTAASLCQTPLDLDPRRPFVLPPPFLPPPCSFSHLGTSRSTYTAIHERNGAKASRRLLISGRARGLRPEAARVLPARCHRPPNRGILLSVFYFPLCSVPPSSFDVRGGDSRILVLRGDRGWSGCWVERGRSLRRLCLRGDVGR